MEKDSALETLEKISKILGADLSSPSGIKATKNIKAKPFDPQKILKRAQGIIKNYNQDNAEKKLANLVALIKAVGGRVTK
jgi:hypothetical protein